MLPGKREIRYRKTDSGKTKKSKTRTLICWLFIDLIIAVLVVGLLLYRPRGYDPADFPPPGDDPGKVSPYLTHDLSPQIYNGAQREEPFDLVIEQKGINEIVAGWGWPRMAQGVMMYAPAVVFVQGHVLLMATANVKGAEFVVTIEIEPKLTEDGLLSFEVTKFKVGAMNVTAPAKMLARKMFRQKTADLPLDGDSIEIKIAESLLNGVPFKPVFDVDGRKIRIGAVSVGEERMVVHLVPASQG